jgi:hypothetical protein
MRQIIAVLAVCAMMPVLAHAAGTPGQKCAQAKNKAASKKLAAKLKCWQKAIGAGAAPDAACLMAAETKYGTAITKIETRGGCDYPGDGPTLEHLVNNAVATLASFTPATPRVCCQDGSSCWYDTPPANCAPFTMGAANSVCDGTGSCVAAPITTGGLCCSNPIGLGTTDPTNCEVGPEIVDAAGCATFGSNGGTFMPNGVCPPDGGLCVPF